MGNKFWIGKIMESVARDNLALSVLSSCIFSFVLCLSLRSLLPFSKAAAQGSAPMDGAQSQLQFVQRHGAGQAGPPVTITLKDALDRARKIDPTLVGAVSDAKSALEDRLQARNAMLPQITATTQYLGDQGTVERSPMEGSSPRRSSRLSRVGSSSPGPFASHSHGNRIHPR